MQGGGSVVDREGGGSVDGCAQYLATTTWATAWACAAGTQDDWPPRLSVRVTISGAVHGVLGRGAVPEKESRAFAPFRSRLHGALFEACCESVSRSHALAVLVVSGAGGGRCRFLFRQINP